MKITKGGLFSGLISTAADSNAIGGITIDNSPTGPGQAPVSNQSNFNSPNGATWSPIIQGITANGSNALLGPFVNFASGSNITFAVSSNTLTINGGGGSGEAGLSSITDGISTVAPVTTLTVEPHSLSGATPSASHAVNRLVTVPDAGAAYEFDLANGNIFDLTLTQNCVFTIAAGAVAGYPEIIVVDIRQGGTGSYTVTHPTEVDWQDPADGTTGGSAPTLWTAVGAVDRVVYDARDGGTTWGGEFKPHGSGGTTSPLTTKGDLYTYSTTDARLPVSAASNSILRPAPAETTGLLWDTYYNLIDNAPRWELVMQDGVTAPPEPLENEAQDDWIYGLVP